MVRLVDLTTQGVGVLAPFAVEQGSTMKLLTRVPDADGNLRSLDMDVEVRSCRPEAEGQYRIGGTLDVRDSAERSLLIEYCYVVLPQQRLANSAEPAEITAQVDLRAVRAS